MSKSRDAFRTISEVSAKLDTPAHVLRFWESKFSQVKPVKRAGGRRYYRPSDVDLLAGIKKVLHEDGMTIKGAQKLLREQGVKHVAALGADVLATAETDTDTVDVTSTAQEPAPLAQPKDDTVESPDTAARNEDKADLSVELTNVVAMPKPTTPRVTLEQVSRETAAPSPAQNDTVAQEATTTTLPSTPETAAPAPEATPQSIAPDDGAAIAATLPADPSDNDSKAPARLFHLLQTVPTDALAAKAETLAPLLARMKDLRDRIPAR